MPFLPQKPIFRTPKHTLLHCKSIPFAHQKHSFYSPKAMLLQNENFEFSVRFCVNRCQSVGYTISTQPSPESRICAPAKKILQIRENSDSFFTQKKVYIFHYIFHTDITDNTEKNSLSPTLIPALCSPTRCLSIKRGRMFLPLRGRLGGGLSVLSVISV